MRPKKIYLNPKTIDQLSSTDGEGKTMRVRAFKGKNDAEYVDLSQVWHPNTDIPEDGDADLLYILHETEYSTEDDMTFHTYNDSKRPDVAFPAWEQVKSWAYLSDILPRPESVTIKNQ